MTETVCYISEEFEHKNILEFFLKDSVSIKAGALAKTGKEEILLVNSNGIHTKIIWNEMVNIFYQYSLDKVRKNYDQYYIQNVFKDILNP